MDRRWTNARTGWLWAALLVLALPAAGQNQNVTVNDQPTAEQAIGEINTLRAADRYDAATELAQELIEGGQFKLVGLGEGYYVDAAQWCRQQLLRDAELREAYRARYDALAARALEQAMEQAQPMAALGAVYRRYPVTRPGLEAALHYAGWLLESGDSYAAQTLLDELERHPDHDAYETRLASLRGLAAVYNRDSDRLEDATEELGELNQPDVVASLIAISESIDASSTEGYSPLTDTSVGPAELGATLWHHALSDEGEPENWQVNDKFAMPAVTGSMVLVNNGRQLIGLDRASGQRVWVYPDDPSNTAVRGLVSSRWHDLRGVAVGDGVACAVLGECFGIIETRNPFVPPNRLVCIDQQSGQVRWQRNAGFLRENEPTQVQDRRVGVAFLQNTHFVGTPIMAQGMVFALLRRAQAADQVNQYTTWLVAFDAADGAMLWYRHLSVTALGRSGNEPKEISPQMSLSGDTLYMTDSYATAAAIDINSGGYRWLRVLPVGEGMLDARSAGVMSAPVLTESGLMVPLSLTSERMVLLDPDDGTVLQSFDNHPRMGIAQYILDAGSGIIVVSATHVSFWDEDRAEVGWSFQLQLGENNAALGAVTGRYVIIPTSRRVVVLDRETGELIHQGERFTGNIVVRDGDVFAVNDQSVHAYTTWDQVNQRLVQRIEQSPEDPSGGLAMASLAMQQGRVDAVREGVMHAMAAVQLQPIDRVDPISRRVFEQLRALALQAEDTDLRRELYNEMALVTQTARQEVAYHMDAGLFYVLQGEPRRAVDHFHAVLADPTFASQPYTFDGTQRIASDIAQEQITQLIERHGRGIYARHDANAQARIAELAADATADVTTLTAVARQFPLSIAAVDFLIDAGDLRAQQGKEIDAIGLYQQAIARSKNTAQLERAVGQLLNLHLDHMRPDLARHLLERQAALNPRISPLNGDDRRSVRQWQARIEEAELVGRPRSALAEALADPVLVPGRLVGTAPGVDPGIITNRLYLQQPDRRLTCHEAGSPQETVWTATLADEGTHYVLDDHDDQLLIWSVDAGEVFALSPETGETLWSTPLRFDAPVNNAAIGEGQAWPENAIDEVLVTVSDTAVCFGHKTTCRLIAVERAVGGVLWRTELDMPELAAIDTDNWTLAACGRAGHPLQMRNGKLALLDLMTAEPVGAEPVMPVSVTPQSMDLTGGRVVMCGASGLLAIDAATGDALWSQRYTDSRLKGTLAVSGDIVGAESTTGVVHIIDAGNGGQSVGRLLVRSESDPLEIGMQGVGGNIWVTAGRGLFCFGVEPFLQWQDAIEVPNLQPRIAMVGQDRVALIADTEPDLNDPRLPADSQNPKLALFILDREGGRLINQYDLAQVQGVPEPERAQLVGSGIVLPVGDQTLVIPAAR